VSSLWLEIGAQRRHYNSQIRTRLNDKYSLQLRRDVAIYWHLKTNYCKSMEKPKIIAYLKPTCGWSNGVRAVLRKYDLPFEDRDIINDPAQRQEMVEKSGQMLSPCVEIDGQMLADISGEEVEAWLLANSVVQPNGLTAEVPINQACGAHHRR
jgi:monothiol glutaredoxin